MPTCDIYRGGSIVASDVAIVRLIAGIREGNRVVAQRWNLGWPPQKTDFPYAFPFWEYRLEFEHDQDVRDTNYRLDGANMIQVGENPDEVRLGETKLRVIWVEITRFDDPEWRRKSVYVRHMSGPKPDEYPAPPRSLDRLDYLRYAYLNDISGDQGEPLNADGDFTNEDFLQSLLDTAELGVF